MTSAKNEKSENGFNIFTPSDMDWLFYIIIGVQFSTCKRNHWTLVLALYKAFVLPYIARL